MSIVGRVEKWWNERNAVPEEKAKLLNERISRLFSEDCSGHKEPSQGNKCPAETETVTAAKA